MKNTILKQVNDIGAELGYPFYVYPDGTCGKSIVSGKMNAVGIVKKEFPVKELKSDFLSCSDENDKDVLAHLSQIGEKLGFPFYVYADGTCGTKSTSQTDNLPFLMFVKKKFAVEQLVLDEELLKILQAKKAKETSNQSRSTQSSSTAPARNKNSSAKIATSSVRVSPNSPVITLSDVDLIAYVKEHPLSEDEELLMLKKRSDDVIIAYVKKYSLYKTAEKLMIEKSSDDVIKAYVEKQWFWSNKVRCLMLEKRSDDVIKTYFEKWSLCNEEEKLMLEKCSDDVIKAYVEKWPLCDDAQKLMVEKCSDDVIKAYLKKYDLVSSAKGTMHKRYGFFWFLRA